MTKAIVTMVMAAASMQAETLIAKVHFPFAASGVKMPAGAYRVVPTAQGSFSVENEVTGKKVVLMGFSSASDRNRATAGLHLGFACAASGCALTQVWLADRGIENGKVRRELEATSGSVQVATVAMTR